jgi:flagellar basal-body rod protein FlgC
MDVISSNIANANSVAKPGETPYARKAVVLEPGARGVRINSIHEDTTRPFVEKVDWSNPYHDPRTGIVKMSNVDPVMEMVDMIGASRAYEANIAAFNTAKGMMKSALNIGRM